MIFNGNVFAELGRRLADVLFAEVPSNRRREITSAVAHFIAGVLDQDSMAGIVDGMMKRVIFEIGGKVRSLRGSLHGTIIGIQGDTVQIKSSSTGAVLRCAADSLVNDFEAPPARPA